MQFKLENEHISIAINEYGAELSSLKSKDSGIEYLWQGNPEVWSGQSPILFPIVGTLLDNKCKIDGKEYEMLRHGIARKRIFEVKEKFGNHITLSQKYNSESLEKYPYKYVLEIEFRLEGKRLSVTHTVINADSKAMYFSIGAHPAFNCKIGDYLEFENNETLVCEKIDGDSILDGKHYPTLKNEKTFEITKDVFNDDAHILSGMKSEVVYLKSKNRPQQIKFDFGKAPYLGLWAKPGADYVCIEPWYGINDSRHIVKDFSEKRGIQKIESLEKFIFPWSAEIIE